ncbi:MAG TPA: DUF3267 domain-containing protein [Rhodothermales bacterium]|nr:DUF3267 domain-containing protein [Rhodothermales bacterium]
MVKKDTSVSMGEANLLGVLAPLPVVGALSVAFVEQWGVGAWVAGIRGSLDHAMMVLVAVVLGVIAHELLHGLTWGYFGRKPLTALKFGFYWKTLTPYAHCTEPITIEAYRAGTLMPGLALGVLPALVGLIEGDAALFTYGLLFTLAAGGDFLVLWLLRSAPSGSLVEDHAHRVGCYVWEPGGEAMV